ncbi:MAG: alpha/beta fold hydrolase, partial [Promethearchaeota archaeon]
MEFKEPQFDGPYEVVEMDIEINEEIMKGLIYFPPERFKKPYPLVLYFHGFPQLFPLQEIVKNFEFLLKRGYSFLIFNFRGYRFSDGNVSIKGQISDALQVIEFVNKMSKKKIFDLNNINIIAHDFGAYIALLICSQVNEIKNLLLLSPILDLKKHVYNPEFEKALNYINKFLPGNVRGIENTIRFIMEVKNELSERNLQINHFIGNLKNKKLKVIIGDKDKITPILEVQETFADSNIIPEISVINNMDHECMEEEECNEIQKEIDSFFRE